MTKRPSDTPNTGTAIVAVGQSAGALARVSQPRAGAHIDVPPQREWLTAAEAAAERLPGAPLSKSQFNRIIQDNDIATRKRQGRGGGCEFHWTSLPTREARDEYLRRYGVATIESERADNSKSREAQRDLQAEARHEIVKAAQSFITDFKLEIGAGLDRFCSAYARKRTKLPDWIYIQVPQLKPHHLRKWESIIRKQGSGALIDKRGRPDGTGLIDRDPKLRAFIITTFTARPHLTAQDLTKAIAADLHREINLRTMQAWLANFRGDNAALVKALTDPDAHKSHYGVAFGDRGTGIDRLNQQWQLDATRADLMCQTADGRQVRMNITALIDVATRRAMVVVSDQPSGITTQALLRRAILAWGIPETIKTDNGKDFANRAVRRFCDDIGIALKFSRPFSPQEKPFIERFFGTLNHTFLPLLPAYVGSNIGQRKAIENRKSFQHRFGEQAQLVIETSLSPEGLQARIDVWLKNIYEQNIHDGLKGKLSPAMAGTMLAEQARWLTDERALDALLLEAPDAAGIRTVVKKGIRVGSRWYICAELGGMVGDKVHVRLAPEDASRIVVYSHDREIFLCVAECTDGMAADRQMQIAQAAHGMQKRQLRLIRNDNLKVQKDYPAAGLADRILKDAEGDGFILQDDARKAMDTAARPRLRVMQAGLDALDQSRQPQQPIEPTAEEHASAAAYFDMTERLPEAQAMLECDGYSRPNFGDDDVGFWLWAEAQRAQGWSPDDTDRDLLAALDASPAFHQLLSTARNRA